MDVLIIIGDRLGRFDRFIFYALTAFFERFLLKSK